MPKPEDLRPMSEFDPSQPALVYDHLNDETFEWLPARHGADYERYAEPFGDGIGRRAPTPSDTTNAFRQATPTRDPLRLAARTLACPWGARKWWWK